VQIAHDAAQPVGFLGRGAEKQGAVVLVHGEGHAVLRIARGEIHQRPPGLVHKGGRIVFQLRLQIAVPALGRPGPQPEGQQFLPAVPHQLFHGKLHQLPLHLGAL